MKISHTYCPDRVLSQEEWMKEFNVSSRVPKYENTRAKEIMSMWEDDNSESLFKKVIARLKVASPKECPYL